MKKLIMIMAVASLMITSHWVFAAGKKASATQAAKQHQEIINVYAKPNDKSAIVDQVAIAQRMVPFYGREGWMKVGNPEDGKVGWINKEAYQKALDKSFHRNLQMVFVEVNQQGKGTPEIVAYRNGEKLNSSQSKALYQRLQKQQAQLNLQLRQYQTQMARWFHQGMQAMNSGFMALPSMMSSVQPIIIFEPPQPSGQKGGPQGAAATTPVKLTQDKVKNS